MSADSLDIEIIERILEENKERWERLQANYNPVTGEGLEELLGEKRVKLEIADFAIPVQWVPEEMMSNKLVKQIAKAGSIEKYITSKKWKLRIPTFHEIEIRLRRIRHKYDFCHWAYFCIRIDAKLGGRIRFKLNYAQIQVLKLCMSLFRAGEPINIVIDKARQWGGSTFCIFFQFWILAHWDHYHSFAVAAHVQDAAHNVLNMLKSAILEYPAWDLGCEEGESLHFANYGGNKHGYVIKDSHDNQVLPGIIFIGSAERPDSLRSGRISGAHYTEVGVWPNTPGKSAEDLVADISGGIPKQAKFTMQVFESTAKTSDDYFHDLYYDALAGASNFKPIFIPFYFIPHDTMKIDDYREFVKWLVENKDKDYATGGWKSPGKYYWWLWEQGASLESIQWYRYEEKNYTKRSQMVNEAPSSAEESFQSSGQRVFDFYDVDRFAKKCSEPMYEGDLISDGRKGKEVLDNIRFLTKQGGNLKIWEMPDDSPISDRYVVAVDIGGPNDTSDYSSVRVLDRLMMMPEFGLSSVPNVVAEMHYHTAHDLLAYDAMRLAAWYNNALLVIESNTLETRDQNRDTGGDGFEYILEIVHDLYPNLYMRQAKEEDVKQGIQYKFGFHTNTSTKPKIIDHMKECLRDNLWREPSRTCCAEMSVYIEDKKKLTAPPKKHDDVLMATAILLWVAYKEMEIPKWQNANEAEISDVIEGNNFVTL